MRYSWMSQQTWRVWHSSWYMPITFMGGSIKEDMLSWFAEEDIFKVLDSFVTSNGLWWSKCVGICIDGAKAMTGRHSGVVTRMKAVNPDATWVHCSIHRPYNAFTTYRSVLVIKGQSIEAIFFLTTCMMKSFSHNWPIWVMFFLT